MPTEEELKAEIESQKAIFEIQQQEKNENNLKTEKDVWVKNIIERSNCQKWRNNARRFTYSKEKFKTIRKRKQEWIESIKK